MAKSPDPLQLAPETWGERFHRAYRTARRVHGLQYRGVAEKVSLVYPTSEQTLLRLEACEDIPSQSRQRTVAFFALIAMGFDPGEFGLTIANASANGFDMRRVKGMLDPRSRFSVQPGNVTKSTANQNSKSAA